MDRLTDEELKEVRIYPVREKVDIITMPQKRQLEEIRRHLKDVLDSDVDEKVHNILSVVDYQKRTTNFSSAKQGEHCIRNILMNWQYQKDMTMTDYVLLLKKDFQLMKNICQMNYYS